MLRWTVIITLFVALGVEAQERVVDLTPKSQSAGSPATWRERVDCRGRSTGRSEPAPTLKVTIARLDRSEVVPGAVRGRY